MKQNNKIAFVASECLGYAKTGGLADVVSSLSINLAKNKNDVVVIMPLYQSIKSRFHEELIFLESIDVLNTYIGIYYIDLNNHLRMVFVDNEGLYGRELLYSYPDDEYRFGIFDKAIFPILKTLKFKPNVIHCHDWQAGLVPYILNSEYHNDPFFSNAKTLLTIHNLKFQGWAELELASHLGLYYSTDYIFKNKINFLKCGIQTANKVNTVSPTYKNQTYSDEFGEQLQNILHSREPDYCGILNGIDYDVFSPRTDLLLKQTYNLVNFAKNKKINKQFLFEKFGMTADLDKPLYVMVTRITSQKGFDLINPALNELLEKGSVFILGSGDTFYTDYLHYMSNTKHNFCFYDGYNEELAHLVYGAADFYLMPSTFEPCGLSQLIAMSYGTVPIVFETGGLKDSVIPYNEYEFSGTGISFSQFNLNDFCWALNYSEFIYYNKKHHRVIVKNCMKADFSAKHCTENYLNLYLDMLNN